MLLDHFSVGIVMGRNYIITNWETTDPILQQEIRSVQVMVSSECPTGIQPTQTQAFNVMASQTNSVNASGLGKQVIASKLISNLNNISIIHNYFLTKLTNFSNQMFSFIIDPLVPYRVTVAAVICQRNYQLYNRTTTIQGGIYLWI